MEVYRGYHLWYRIASHRVAVLSWPAFSSPDVSCVRGHRLTPHTLPPSSTPSSFLLLSFIHSLLTGECRGGEAKAETAEDGVARALPGVGVDTVGDLLHGI